MKLNLKRPIVFFDLETTGVDTARDRIVEISMIKIMPDGEEQTRTRRLNPGIPIPPEAPAVDNVDNVDRLSEALPKRPVLQAKSGIFSSAGPVDN